MFPNMTHANSQKLHRRLTPVFLFILKLFKLHELKILNWRWSLAMNKSNRKILPITFGSLHSASKVSMNNVSSVNIFPRHQCYILLVCQIIFKLNVWQWRQMWLVTKCGRRDIQLNDQKICYFPFSYRLLFRTHW